MADPADKYTLVDSLAMAPGHDWLTKSITGPFIDTGVDVKFGEVGRIYISVESVREMALAAGITESVADRLKRETEVYEMGLAQGMKDTLNGDVRDLADRLDRLANQLGGVPPVGSPAPARRVAPTHDSDAGDFPEGDPSVFVTDGPDAAERRGGADEEAVNAAVAGGQGDGDGGDVRPAGVPSSAGDGNPFRI